MSSIKPLNIVTAVVVLAVMFISAKVFYNLCLTVFPPDDLYENKIKTHLELSVAKTYTYEISHAYRGKYCAGFYSKNLPGISEAMPNNLVVKFSVADPSGAKYENTVNEIRDRFWTRDKDGNGILLCCYTVPDNVPVNRPVKVIITVDRPDKIFEEQYGPFSFFIKKFADE